MSPSSKPPSRKRLGRCVLGLLPLMGVIFVEIALRMLGLFGPTPHFRPDAQDPTRLSLGHTIPAEYEGASVAFLPSKKEGAFRVFVVGASTVKGFPFFPWSTIPTLLQKRLDALFPQRDIEVLNAGFEGFTIEHVSELVDEILELDPDLIVLYSGHNEFMVAHHHEIEQDIDPWKRFLKTMSRMHLVRAIHAAIGYEPEEVIGHPFPTDLARVGDHQEVPAELLDGGYRRYESYLQELLEDIVDHDVAVLVSGLVSNMGGQPPFRPYFGKLRGEDERERFRGDLEHAVELYRRRAPDAMQALDALLSQDDTVASVWFMKGNLHLDAQNRDAAYDALTKARDLDGIPMRATSRLNAIVREVAGRMAVPYVDPRETFRERSDRGAPGFDLFSDYCHPGLDGQWLLTEVLLRKMEAADLLPDSGPYPFDREPAREAYADQLGLRSEAFADAWVKNGGQILKQALLQEHPDAMLRQAEICYRRALDAVDAHGGALAGCGFIAVMRGKKQEAVELFEKAWRANPEALTSFVAAYKTLELFRAPFEKLGLEMTMKGAIPAR